MNELCDIKEYSGQIIPSSNYGPSGSTCYIDSIVLSSC